MSEHKSKHSNNQRSLLPLYVINAAINGDEDAMRAILLHFEGYITSLATRQLHDDYGNTYNCINEEIRNELRNRLVQGIRKFKVA